MASSKARWGAPRVFGTARIPNFEITSSHHSLGLSAEYRALVDGLNGDVSIASVHAHFLSSMLSAHGRVSGRHGKRVSLDIDDNWVPVQDLLRLFVSSDKPPLDGAITLRAHFVLPPVHESFLKRAQLDE